MPLGIIIILISVILIFFGYGEEISYILALPNKKAIIFLLLLTFSYTLRPLSIVGISFYYVPYLLLLIYGIFLLTKLEHVFKNILLSMFSSLLLYVLSLKILPQPIGMVYEPFVIYALLIIVINVLFSFGKRSAIFNSVISITIFNTAMILGENFNSIMPPNAFSAVCISSVVSYFPISILSDRKIHLTHKRLFNKESGEELFYKHKSRKW